MTLDLTGDQIHTLLEQQWLGQPAPKVLQVSSNVTYSWWASNPNGSRVDPSSIRIDGVVVDPTATYRVSVHNFLADGGDGFTILQQGTNRLGGPADLDALVDYLRAHSPLQPGLQDRITRLP